MGDESRTVRLTLRMTMEDIPVKAFPTPVAGLVIHRAPGQPGDWWSITLATSGEAVSSYLPSPEAALACAADLGRLADWTRPVNRRSLATQVEAVLRRWGAERCPVEQLAPE